MALPRRWRNAATNRIARTFWSSQQRGRKREQEVKGLARDGTHWPPVPGQHGHNQTVRTSDAAREDAFASTYEARNLNRSGMPQIVCVCPYPEGRSDWLGRDRAPEGQPLPCGASPFPSCTLSLTRLEDNRAI